MTILAAGGGKVEGVLLAVLLQLTIIVLTARVFARLARRFGQPAVVGEIAAGLILGPSALGGLSAWMAGHTSVTGGHDVLALVFRSDVNETFAVLSQLGLVLMLFLVGLDFEIGHLRRLGGAAMTIAVIGIAVPFALGAGLAPLIHASAGVNRFGAEPDAPAFALFMGTALCITAIPVLGRIMTELNITRSRLGTVTMAAAGAGDAVGWILLAAVAGLAKARAGGGQFQWSAIAFMSFATVVFGLLVVFAVRPILSRWIAGVLRRNRGELGPDGLAGVLAAVFLCAVATNLIGIFSIFGAFVLGAALSAEPGFREAVSRALSRFVAAFFLPIFFTYTGLRTNIGSLDSLWLVFLCVVVCAAAFAGKMGGCGFAARLTGFSRREAACIGAMMNARGLMELIVINEGHHLGVLTDSSYCMLVIMSMASNVLTTPLVVRLAPGTELEPMIAQSEFAAARTPPSAEPAAATITLDPHRASVQ